MDEELVNLLTDPETVEYLRGQSKTRQMDWLIRRINRSNIAGVAIATRAYTSPLSGSGSFRLVFVDGRRITVGYHGGPGLFDCNGVRSDSLAEALLAGYVAAELTDDPMSDNL